MNKVIKFLGCLVIGSFFLCSSCNKEENPPTGQFGKYFFYGDYVSYTKNDSFGLCTFTKKYINDYLFAYL